MAEGVAREIRRPRPTLSDADLDVPPRANWGELKPTRWLISTILQHDTYHAGEIKPRPKLARRRRPLALGLTDPA
jgi:hypothetical protein